MTYNRCGRRLDDSVRRPQTLRRDVMVEPLLTAAQPPVQPIRALVAHRESLTRAGLRALLQAQAGPPVDVVAVAATREEAVALAVELRPDVAVIDGGLDGVQVTRSIRGALAPDETGVLLMLGAESDAVVFEALRAGADGLLTTSTSSEDLVRAVAAVAAGEALLAPSIARRLIEDLVARPERLAHPEQLDELTDREREVMALVAAGLSNHQIGERLIISRATAKTHVSRAMVKLHAHDRAQLAVMAYQTGLVFAGGARAAAAAAHRVAGRIDVHPAFG
jgi:DNA-binding NarL/FixJ family response regulator